MHERRLRYPRPSTTLHSPRPILASQYAIWTPANDVSRRKYFSSLERLHIAYTSAHQFNQQHPPSFPAAVNNVDAIQPSPHRHDLALRSPNFARSHSRALPFAPTRTSQYLRKPQPPWADAVSIQAEAQWFYSLPDKVRRQHFTREEQELLTAHLTPIFTPKPGRRKPANISLDTPHRRHIPSEVESPNMNVHTEESRPRRKISKRSSMRRTVSITRPAPQTFMASAASPTSPVSPLFPVHRRDKSHSGTIKTSSRPTVDTNVAAFDPEAVYYRDPEARSKLRQYLLSPQKFDEAVAYGFPSSPPPEDDHDHFKASASSSNNDAQTFLREDSISFIDRYDEADSDYETSEEESPATPANGDEPFRGYNYNRLSIFGSLDSDDLPSLNFKFQPELPPSADIMNPFTNREMTLRMTLTRPDLRANEEELYGWKKGGAAEEDPLALEELPPCNDDSTGAHGAFAVKSNRNSRVLFNKILNKVRRH
jgi:hypothetical protein